MSCVLNARIVGTRSTKTREYVARPSKWGNRFVIGKDGTREEVIEKYMDWFCEQDHLIAALDELRGKDLVCWCAPLRCHADFLLELASSINAPISAPVFRVE